MQKEFGLGSHFFEFTAPGTPQQNGAIERSFATLYGKVRAMLYGAGFDETTCGKLWAEAANCATHNENVTSPHTGEPSSHEFFLAVYQHMYRICAPLVKSESFETFT